MTPHFALSIMILWVVLAVLAIPMFLPEEKPEGVGQSRQERILARLDNHQLVHKARLYNKGTERYYQWYDVEPGAYTLEFYLAHKSSFRNVGLIARHTKIH